MAALFVAAVMAAIAVGTTLGQQMSLCQFNPMCLCRWAGPNMSATELTDVGCGDISLYKMPALPHGPVVSLEVSNSLIMVLEPDAMAGLYLESVKLPDNRIQRVTEKAFSSMATSLTSLDLSSNSIDTVPFAALSELQTLSRLDLKRNQISSIEGNWGSLTDTLMTLFISHNDITDLPRGNDVNGAPFTDQSVHALYDFKKLSSLDVSDNKIATVLKNSLPNSLKNLDLSHNHMNTIPCGVIDRLTYLQNVYLRGNFINQLPEYTFKHKKRLEKMDMGENLLAAIPPYIFNNSIIIRDLNMDCNRIENIPAMAFKGLGCVRIILTRNKIQQIDIEAFVGLEHTLEYLDLEHNLLKRVPDALSTLNRLNYLYISSNFIPEVENIPRMLKVLSLSGNLLTEIPTKALEYCEKLTYLNLGYNQITELNTDDFSSWGRNIETLLLRNNRISRLDANVFSTLTNLKELSLSFNDIHYVDIEAFSNISGSLRILEMSFGMYAEDFPTDLLKSLSNLVYLALDNNNFGTISPDALASFEQMLHLNLISNRIEVLPHDLFTTRVRQHLIDIELSYNLIKEILEGTFEYMPEIQNIDISANKVLTIDPYSFYELPNILKIDLSNNYISEINDDIFINMPNLVTLDLSYNTLKLFSLSSLTNISSPLIPLTLNLSHNQLTSLSRGDRGNSVNILDLSYNRLCDTNQEFLSSLSTSLRRLYYSFNNISKLDTHCFGDLIHLEELLLDNNNIAIIRRRAFQSLDNLQILDLSHNSIELLQGQQFSNLKQLRILNLKNNNIRSLTRDVFQNTLIEKLDLSCNEIVSLPSSALSEIGFTLRSFRASFNLIEHVDSVVFADASHIWEIDLSHNAISTVLDDVFSAVDSLQILDLSHNPLTTNLREVLDFLPQLTILMLSSTNLNDFPQISLPDLQYLDLCSNNLEDIQLSPALSLPKLTELNLSGNKLTAVPSNLWPHISKLKSLDLSRNPIKHIGSDSFYGLFGLRNLNIQDLTELNKIHRDCLSHIKLESLSIQTYEEGVNIATVGSLISTIPTLHTLSLKVTEHSLVDQLKLSNNIKLTYLELHGKHLSSIDVNVFEEFRDNNVLNIKIQDSAISELPIGVFYSLRDVNRLTIDLRRNAITSVTPDAFYPNTSSWEIYGTKLISGGLLMSDNPLQCDCGLVWLGHWLRRWLRESVQLQTVTPHQSLQMVREARSTTCLDSRTGKSTPLLELHPEDLFCHASALSSAGTTLRGPPSASWKWSVLLTPSFVISSVLNRGFWF